MNRLIPHELVRRLRLGCAASLLSLMSLAMPMAAETSVTPEAATPEGPAKPADIEIGFLTGSNYSPFTHRDRPEGGMLTEIVRTAMNAIGQSRSFSIEFVDDWSRHLTELLPSRAFDLGFPWFQPDCSIIDRLSPEMQLRCRNFDFSAPLFEVVVGYYTRRGHVLESADHYSDLVGSRLCRPSGYFTFDLEQSGLVEPEITMLTPVTPEDCFRMLDRGEIDIVTLNVLLATEEISKLGFGKSVTELSSIASIQSLHAVAAKDHPQGAEMLELLNGQISDLKRRGLWEDIVIRHLDQHLQRTF